MTSFPQPKHSPSLRGLYVCAIVFGVSSLFEISMDLSKVHGVWVLADNVAAGIASGLLVFVYERWQQHSIQALRKSEEKFSKSFSHSPMALTLTTAKDHRYLDVNKTFQRLTGWSRAEVIGKTPFDLHIWADPTRRVEFVRRLTAEGRIEQWEDRFLRKDGSELWGLGAAEIMEIGNQTCVLSVIADVTDRKRAQEAAVKLGGRLLHAQEEERGRIARELHDDINQKIALIAFKLQAWETNACKLTPGSCAELREIREQLLQLSKDIQVLSHRLHSPKLEYLGFLKAARSLCDEVAKLHQVQIDLTQSNFPDHLPNDVSICLYRVLQEALQNAMKHSGARHFSVHLCANSDGLEMTVGDTGAGFEIEQAFQSHGLGLISMQERLHLVGGYLHLKSQRGLGTTIQARIPAQKIA